MGRQQKIHELRNYIAFIEPQLDDMKNELILRRAILGIGDDTKVFKSLDEVKLHNLSQMVDELQCTLDHYKAEINTSLGEEPK